MNKLIISLLLIPLFSLAQEKLTLEAIWGGAFRAEYLQEIHHLNDGSNYSILQFDKTTSKTKIVAKSYINNEEKVLLTNTEAKLDYFESYAFSKDEQKVVLGYNSTSRYRYSSFGNFSVYDFNSKKSTVVYNGKIINPKLSPDGKKVGFVFENNIFIKDLSSNTVTQITKDGKKNTIINGLSDWVYEEEFELIEAFRWSPDSKHIAFLKFDETNVKEYSMPIYGDNNYPTFETFKYPKAGETNSIVTAHLYTIANKKTIDLQFPKTPHYIPRLQWKNNFEIVFQTLNRHQNELYIYSFNTIKNKASIIYSEKNDTYIEIDNHLTFTSAGDFYLTSEKDGFNHIYYYKSNGKETQITHGNWEVTKLYNYNEAKGFFYFQSTKGNEIERQIYSINKKKQLKQLTIAPGTHDASFTSNQSLFIDTFSNASTPYTFEVLSAKNGEKINVLKNNAPLLQRSLSYNLPKKEFAKVSINGYDLNTYIIKPKNFDSSKKYPVLLYQYSGPGSQMVKNSWHSYNDYWHYLLAEKGYIIACIDGRGTGSKGASFKKTTQLQLGKLEAEDQIAFAKYLGNLDYINKKRIGIWGWSFGGFTTLNAILKDNTVFKSAISVAPVTHWGFYDTIYTERFLTTPKENPKGYNNNSPITLAQNLNCPLLLVHGGADDNVHLQNSLQMSAEFVKFNKPFDQEIYTNKNHGIYGGKTRLHLYSKLTEFILHKL